MRGRDGRRKWVHVVAGRILAFYLRLVRKTNKITIEPSDYVARHTRDWPVLVTMWHGEHFLMPFSRPEGYDVSVMVSRSQDGEVVAVAASLLGLKLIRASGGQKAHHYAKRGGARGVRETLEALDSGSSVALTADMPKGPAKVCGKGLVTMARLSGRPIVPMAIATSRRIRLKTWDTAALNLPFGRMALVVGEQIHIDGDADEAAMDAARRQVEEQLNRATARAYALVDGRDT